MLDQDFVMVQCAIFYSVRYWHFNGVTQIALQRLKEVKLLMCQVDNRTCLEKHKSSTQNRSVTYISFST